MRIALVTDAWAPQMNGVVRTLSALADGLTAAGHDVLTVTPDLFRTMPCPTDPTIRLALVSRRRLSQFLNAFAPDTIHIATEGPLGLAARAYCISRLRCFTTSFHTKFPEYLNARLGLPVSLGYAALRRFHARSSAVMVATETVRRELLRRAFQRVFRGLAGSTRISSGPMRRRPSFYRDPSFFKSAAYRPKRTCPISSISTCPDQNSLSAMGHYCRCCAAATRRFASPVGKMARRWSGTTPQRTYWCCRAKPRRLGWCCWRRLPAASRSQRFLYPVRST